MRRGPRWYFGKTRFDFSWMPYADDAGEMIAARDRRWCNGAMNSLRGVRNRGWLSRPNPSTGLLFVPRRRSVAAVVDSFTSDAIERERSMSVASEQVSAVGFNRTLCLHCTADSSRRSNAVDA
jgi:hypothetical protein